MQGNDFFINNLKIMNKVIFAITFLYLFLAVMPSASAQKSGKSKRSQAMSMLAEPKTLDEV